MTTMTTALTVGEPFTHTVPRGWTKYQFAEISFAGSNCPETVGLMVDGEPHDLCRRCGLGYGHYLFNGEDDICYECGGEGYGRPASLADIERRAINRMKAAERRERKRLAEIAERDAKLAAWKAANAELVAELAKHLPPMESWDADGTSASAVEAITGHEPQPGDGYRGPAHTFPAKLAVQVFDDLKPLTDRQAEAVKIAMASMAERAAQRRAAGHWGTVGKRGEAEVEVVGVKSFESDYGTRWLVTMKTGEGHVLKTWTSGNFIDTALNLKNHGGTVRVKATPKDHGEYNGLPETTVTRVTAVV
jgi:ribosomal protein L37E